MYARSEVPAEHRRSQVHTQPLSDKQLSFIRSLIDERDLFASPKHFDAHNAMDEGEYVQALERMKAEAATLSKTQASEWIGRLLELPQKPKAQRQDTNVPDVPNGRYALEDPDDELNPIKFYKVNHGKAGGRWEGFVFVDRFVSDETYPVKGHARIAVLETIAANPLEAAQRFGREENACCICGRRLTRRLSRHLGIGPVCGGRNEWIDADVIASARQELRDLGYDPDEEVSA